MSMFLRASLMLKAVHVSTIKLVNQNVNHIGVQEKRTETPPPSCLHMCMATASLEPIRETGKRKRTTIFEREEYA